MLEYLTNQFGGYRRVDIAALKIAKKVAYYDMSASDIYAELKKMGCPRIAPGMAKPDLLLRYGVWLQEQCESEAK